VRIHALMALGRFGRQEATPEFRHMASEQEPHGGVQFLMSYALTRDDKPDPKPIRQALIDYDLKRMGSAREGEAAPNGMDLSPSLFAQPGSLFAPRLVQKRILLQSPFPRPRFRAVGTLLQLVAGDDRAQALAHRYQLARPRRP